MIMIFQIVSNNLEGFFLEWYTLQFLFVGKVIRRL